MKRIYNKENYSKRKIKQNKRISNKMKRIFKDHLKINYHIIKKYIKNDIKIREILNIKINNFVCIKT